MDKMTLKIAKAWVLGLFTCRETFLKTYGVKGSSHSTLCSLDFFFTPPLFLPSCEPNACQFSMATLLISFNKLNRIK